MILYLKTLYWNMGLASTCFHYIVGAGAVDSLDRNAIIVLTLIRQQMLVALLMLMLGSNAPFISYLSFVLLISP